MSTAILVGYATRYSSTHEVAEAVKAALSGNPRLILCAIAHDPPSAAVLSLAEIKDIVNGIRDCLPQFSHFEV